MLAGGLLFGLATVAHGALRQAHVALDQRERQVQAVRAMQQQCDHGQCPGEAQLLAVAALFPGGRLVAARMDDAVFLTFADKPLAATGEPLALAVR